MELTFASHCRCPAQGLISCVCPEKNSLCSRAEPSVPLPPPALLIHLPFIPARSHNPSSACSAGAWVPHSPEGANIPSVFPRNNLVFPLVTPPPHNCRRKGEALKLFWLKNIPRGAGDRSDNTPTRSRSQNFPTLPYLHCTSGC